MLRHKMSPVDYPGFDVVMQIFPQCLADDSERLAAIVADQILYVFQKESFRTLCGNNPRHVKEKSALRCAFESMRATKSVFLAHTCD